MSNENGMQNAAHDEVFEAAEFESMITTVLDRKTEVAVPFDFASRVLTTLPTQLPQRRKPSVAWRAAVVSAVLLVIAIFLLAPHAVFAATNFAFAMEMILVAQLTAIAYYFAASRSRT